MPLLPRAPCAPFLETWVVLFGTAVPNEVCNVAELHRPLNAQKISDFWAAILGRRSALRITTTKGRAAMG